MRYESSNATRETANVRTALARRRAQRPKPEIVAFASDLGRRRRSVGCGHRCLASYFCSMADRRWRRRTAKFHPRDRGPADQISIEMAILDRTSGLAERIP